MKGLYMEYDEVLIGKRCGYSLRFFGKDNARSGQNAVLVMSYAFPRYLRWPPELLKVKLDRELLESLKLWTLVKYIPYPVDYDREKDFFYLVSLVYGERYGVSVRDMTVHTYERVLSGDAPKFPKDYFSGTEGLARAGICLQYLINHRVVFSSINELYFIFASERGYYYLKKYKLLTACREGFPTPVDFLHFCLAPEQKSDLYYHFYRFKYLREMLSKKGRKRRTVCTFLLKGDLP